MNRKRKRKCRFCPTLFVPDPRLGSRQQTCDDPECRKALKAENNALWRKANPDYFRNDYPRYVGPLPFQVVHITELLVEHLDEIRLGELAEVVTYHDPCRLGRFLGIYDEPREVIQAIPGIELAEMRADAKRLQNRANALCCGSAGWINCGRCAKRIQMVRLRQAQATGAERMITACPKCRIHLSCALKDAGDEITVELEDLTGLLARAMEGVESKAVE